MNRVLKLAFLLASCCHSTIAQVSTSQTTTPEAQLLLGNESLKEKDYGPAMTWFRKAADQGNAAAENNVGWLYENGWGVTQNYAEALNWYRKAADSGELHAQENLAHLYQDGLGTKVDYDQALVWYRKAADRGSGFAMRRIGWFYDQGLGSKQDYVEALKWYETAADKGDAYAEYNIGVLYERGEGVTQDYSVAMAWYYRSANQGVAPAETHLGLLYNDGHGVQQDYAKAAFWYRKAAEQNDADAENNLGWLYDKGLGVEQDSQEAINWYRKAANQGHVRAQANLAALRQRESKPDQTSTPNATGSPARVPMMAGGILPPRTISAPDPEYSEAARKAWISGAVMLSLTVDASGQPQNIKVLSPLGYGLDEEAVNTIKTWKFDPATKDGKPVAVQIIVEVTFRLYGSGIGRVELASNIENEKIDAYLSPVIAEAGKCWNGGSSASHNAGTERGPVTIQFSISKEGAISGTQIASSSGDQLLDRAARDCVTGLKPDKPFPPDIRAASLTVNMQMLYNTAEMSINPSSARLQTGDKEQFYISTAGVLSQSAQWSITGAGCTGDGCGAISAEGLYTAPRILPDPPYVRIHAVLPGANPLSVSCTVTLFQKSAAAFQKTGSNAQ